MNWSPPLPPDDPRAPKYWRHEQSGILEPVITRYLEVKPLDAVDIGIMRAYLRQWFNSPVWDMNPHNCQKNAQELETLRRRVHSISTNDDIKSVLKYALHLGIDPL
jgi:hypothetical protein